MESAQDVLCIILADEKSYAQFIHTFPPLNGVFEPTQSPS